MVTMTGIFDGKQLLLDQAIQLDEPHYVEIIIKEAVAPPVTAQTRGERRQKILSYAGMWQALPDEAWETLQEILGEQRPFFPEREVAW